MAIEKYAPTSREVVYTGGLCRRHRDQLREDVQIRKNRRRRITICTNARKGGIRIKVEIP